MWSESKPYGVDYALGRPSYFMQQRLHSKKSPPVL